MDEVLTGVASPTLLNAGMGEYARLEWHDYYAHFIHLIPDGCRVLDVGSGTGGLAAWLVEHRHCEVTCVDASPEAVTRCRSKALTAHAIDLNSNETIPGSYDLVLFSSSLESVLDPCRVLRQVQGNLGRGGRVLIWMPNSGYAGARLACLRGKAIKCMGHSSAARVLGIWGYDDIQFFTKASLDLALRETGYVDLQWHLGSPEVHLRSFRGWLRAVAFCMVGLLCGFRQPGLYSPFLCVSARRA